MLSGVRAKGLVRRYSLFFHPEGLIIVESEAENGRSVTRDADWARERMRESMVDED